MLWIGRQRCNIHGNDLLPEGFSLPSAFLYGENLLGQPQRTQTSDGEEVFRLAGGVEGKERLFRPRATASRCKSDAGGQSLPGYRPATRFYSAIQDFTPDFSRVSLE